jgi:hypothetical protein
MKYAVEMGSGAIILVHIPNFIMIGSVIQKLTERIHRHGDRIKIALAYFRKVALKTIRSHCQYYRVFVSPSPLQILGRQRVNFFP